MITVAGADRVLTMDLHQGQIQGFFNIPVDELTAVHMLSNYFLHKHLEDTVVVTDLGFAKRARAFAEALDAPLAVIEKRRIGNLDRAELMNVIGDVRGRRAIIVDDEIDTAGTLIEIVRALEREGVDRDLRLRHPRRPERPGDRADLRESALREIVLTDTVPLPPAKRICQDHDDLGRAAHRRGDQADPSRRVGRGAVQQRGLVHPGDAALGGRPAAPVRHARRARPRRRRPTATMRSLTAGRARLRRSARATDEPPAPPARRQGRRRAAAGRRAELAAPAPIAALGRGPQATASCRRCPTPR